MGALAGVAGLVGTGMNSMLGTYNSFSQAAAQQRENEYKASTLESQADEKERQAEETLRLGALKADEQEVSGRLSRAKQRVAYAASGVKVNEGTPVDVLADQAAWNDYEKQKIRYSAETDGWGLRYDAAQLRNNAAATRAGGVDPWVAGGVTLAQSTSGAVTAYAKQSGKKASGGK